MLTFCCVCLIFYILLSSVTTSASAPENAPHSLSCRPYRCFLARTVPLVVPFSRVAAWPTGTPRPLPRQVGSCPLESSSCRPAFLPVRPFVLPLVEAQLAPPWFPLWVGPTASASWHVGFLTLEWGTGPLCLPKLRGHTSHSLSGGPLGAPFSRITLRKTPGPYHGGGGGKKVLSTPIAFSKELALLAFST